jgi:hypothetical protein
MRLLLTFPFFFNAISQKVLSEESLKSLGKMHYATLCVLDMYFHLPFFDIYVHFITHLI